MFIYFNCAKMIIRLAQLGFGPRLSYDGGMYDPGAVCDSAHEHRVCRKCIGIQKIWSRNDRWGFCLSKKKLFVPEKKKCIFFFFCNFCSWQTYWKLLHRIHLFFKSISERLVHVLYRCSTIDTHEFVILFFYKPCENEIFVFLVVDWSSAFATL